MDVTRAFGRLAVSLFLLSGVALTAQSGPDDDVAVRQLESGRSFARRGNYTEALKDFRAVAETHSASSAADNALLEIARYYLDVAPDRAEAEAAVDAILKKYPTSDSAPEAYVMAGRLALARSRQPADLEAALANFDRVARLFPTSDAVPRAMQLAGDTLWHAGRFEEALANYVRVEVDYPASPAAVDAFLGASRALVSLGDPTEAMGELQQVRDRAPGTPEAELALSRITLLHRLYVRARNGPAFALAPETAGPARLDNVLGLAVSSRNAVYWGGGSGLGLVTPGGQPPPALTRVRGVTIDQAGDLVALDAGALRAGADAYVPLMMPRPNNPPVPLNRVDAAVQLSNGQWLVADSGERGIHRFSRTGEYLGPFAAVRVSRLAVNAVDEVAGIDRDQRSIVIFDEAGKLIERISARAASAGYDFRDLEDLTFDAFGHLYVLDRTAIAVFSPHPATPLQAATAAARRPYRLMTSFSEPDRSQTGFRRALAFALDQSGGVYLYDERARRLLVYR